MVADELLTELLGNALDDEGDPAILDGALAAFLDFGIKRTSMGEIAKRSGVSPATLYRRFASKNAVVTAVGLREARRFVTTVDGAVDRTADPRSRVAAGFVAFATTLARNQLLRRLLVTEPDAFLPYVTTEAGPLLALGRGYIASILSEFQPLNGMSDKETEQVAEIFARLALSLALTPDGVIPLDDATAAAAFAESHLFALTRIPA